MFQLPSLGREEKKLMHLAPRLEKINKSIKFIESFTPEAEKFMLDNSKLDVDKISPKLIEVKSGSIYEKLFRWWNLTWWSLPYEKAYGRQMRFLVWDEGHNAPIGLIGLQSPILRWKIRDDYLGISKEQRDFWINQSMNAQRLGSLPPYNKFLGGKLVALMMVSDDVRDSFRKKYSGYKTLLMKRQIPANLLFITTTGAYGKSSVYNRLRINGNNICDFIGNTNGSGSFHIPDTLYEGFIRYLREHDIKAGRGFGNGPSAKMQIISRAMSLLGFKKGTQHGVERAVYFFPFAQNIGEVIQCKKRPIWYNRSTESLTEYWKKRWAIKRMNDYPKEKLMFSKKEYIATVKKELDHCKNPYL